VKEEGRSLEGDAALALLAVSSLKMADVGGPLTVAGYLLEFQTNSSTTMKASVSQYANNKFVNIIDILLVTMHT
jgi:hypothetical protein